MTEPQNEQGVIDSFKRLMSAHGAFRQARWDGFSMGGKDRHFLADYVFTDSTRFCLIEFKDNRRAQATELGKPIVDTFCAALRANPEMRTLSEKCHHISHLAGGDIVTAPYATAICECNVGTEKSSGRFCQLFGNPPPDVNVGYSEFGVYVAFISDLAGRTPEDFVVVADNVGLQTESGAPQEMVVRKLEGVAKLKEWLEQHWPRPALRHPKSP